MAKAKSKKMTPSEWESSPLDIKLDKAQAKKGVKEGSKKDLAVDKKYIKKPTKGVKKKK